MSAISELIIYIIYGIFLIGGISFLVLAWLATTNKLKIIYFLFGIISIICFTGILLSSRNALRKSELDYVGTYDLDNYPNCQNCILELKENNTFIVQNQNDNIVLEKGDWHYESGGDYIIVYINGESDQLGSGKFSYSNLILSK